MSALLEKKADNIHCTFQIENASFHVPATRKHIKDMNWQSKLYVQMISSEKVSISDRGIVLSNAS